MSSKAPIGYIDIRVFAHATEDEDKVLKAVHNIVPAESVDIVTFKKANLSGHHGNPIIMYQAKVKDRNLAQTVFAKLCSGLTMLDRELMTNMITDHLDKGNLYLRLDKQSAYQNQIRLGSADPIHLRIHFKKHTSNVVDICRQFGLLL